MRMSFQHCVEQSEVQPLGRPLGHAGCLSGAPHLHSDANAPQPFQSPRCHPWPAKAMLLFGGGGHVRAPGKRMPSQVRRSTPHVARMSLAQRRPSRCRPFGPQHKAGSRSTPDGCGCGMQAWGSTEPRSAWRQHSSLPLDMPPNTWQGPRSGRCQQDR
jgi:hypothetical protein